MSSAALLPVLAATGMVAEAEIARGQGVLAFAGGGDPARLALMLQGALDRGAKGVISFGIAGGLAPGYAPGQTIVAEGVHADGQRFATDRHWVERLSRHLPHARRGDLVGVDRIVAGAGSKAALFEATGAVAVDMESHIAARLAAQYGVPFAALRIVADPAQRTLPEAATVGMRSDGSMDARAVMRSLVRRPGDIPALIRTAMDASAAFAALKGNRRRLSGLLGFEEAWPTVAGTLPERPSLEVGLFGGGADVQVENG